MLHSSSQPSTISDLAATLKSLYCGTTAIEAEYIEYEAEKEWLYNKYEEVKATMLHLRQNFPAIIRYRKRTIRDRRGN